MKSQKILILLKYSRDESLPWKGWEKMPKKTKKTAEPQYNIDDLFNKVTDLARRMEILELDTASMAKELIEIGNEHTARRSLLDRIKQRLGL